MFFAFLSENGIIDFRPPALSASPFFENCTCQRPSLARQVSEEAVKIYLENGQMKTYSYKDRDDVTVEVIALKGQIKTNDFKLHYGRQCIR
jgi:hypothetical protein